MHAKACEKPPHFHVWYDNYQAEVTIKDGIVRGEMPRRVLRLVYEWIDWSYKIKL